MTVLPGLEGGRLKDLAPLRQGPLARALEALNGAGEETRLVGGAVRDLALGEPVLDLDLATTAATDEVIRRAEAAGFKVAPTGVAHGTVTLVVDGRPIETTTLREDVETDGRWAKVAFGRDFAADARRRDFTINALSLGADGNRPRLCRRARGSRRRAACASSATPSQRIREDYLRILRFFRLSARYARGALDADGLSAAIRARDGLARLSRERVRAELLKLLAAPRASDVVQTMGECGFLEPILGGLAYPGRLSRLIAIEAERGRGARRSSCGSPRSRPQSRRMRNGCAIGCVSPTPNTSGSGRPPRRSSACTGSRRPLRPTACARSCSAPGATRRATRWPWPRPSPAPPGRCGLRRGGSLSRRRARAEASVQRRRSHRARRRARAPGRPNAAGVSGAVDPGGLSQGAGDARAPHRGGGRGRGARRGVGLGSRGSAKACA